jgi:DNA-binding GntR family transcriptional regulator
MARSSWDVRLTPESGHLTILAAYPLRANSDQTHRNKQHKTASRRSLRNPNRHKSLAKFQRNPNNVPISRESDRLMSRALKQVAGNMSDRARHALLDMIHSRKILPGEILEERRLAKDLGVSRTPLRAALNILEGEGLLERLSNRALRVAEVTVEDYLEILYVRKLLDSTAAEQAAASILEPDLLKLQQRIQRNIARRKPSLEEHLTIDFQLHDMIAAATGNRLLRSVINDLHRRARLSKVERLPPRIAESGKEHLVIIDALLERNGERARKAMLAHLDNVKLNLLDQLSSR